MTSVSALMSPIVSKPARRGGQARLSEGDYTDDRGCEVNPVVLGCLSCPLAVCKYDDPGWQKRDPKLVRRQEVEAVWEDRRTGLTLDEIVSRRGVSERTVCRWLTLPGAPKVNGRRGRKAVAA